MDTATLDEDADSRKQAALELAGGFYVLPVKKGEKRPDPLLVPNGFLDATRNTDAIAQWWDTKPNCNIGVCCGPDYGLVVLDVDCKNGAKGMETFRDLWIDTPTLTAATPSGGRHYYFRHPGVPLKAKLEGIDIKGADGGGYVLVPPSTLPNGAYTWLDREIPIADFPKFLIGELRADKPQKADVPKQAGPADTLKVPEGRRHSRLVELGAIYRGKGLASDEIEVLLWEHARRYFDPPFSADNAGHVREIESVVHWYGGKAAPEEDSRPLVVLSTAELMARTDEIVVPLLDPLLPVAGNLMVHGATGGGKSHLVMSIALAIANGDCLLDWSAVAATCVLFCDGEMPEDELKARLRQYLAGKPAPDNLFWAAARCQPSDMPDLADPAAQGRYLAAIEACQAKVAVFDNLTCLRTTTADNPENSVEAWQPIAAFLRRLNNIGVATITVHHSAKSGTQRGLSAHTAVMDTVLRIAAPGEGQADKRAELDVEIHFEKHRRFGGEATLPVRAKVIGDADGFATWQRAGDDPLVDDVVRLRLQGMSIRDMAAVLVRSKAGIEKALTRAKARGLLPLKGDA